MNKARQRQEDFNETLIDMMCLTSNKKHMKQLLEVYMKSNKLTEDILALKEDLNNSTTKTKEHLEKYKKIKSEYEELIK